MLMIAGTITKIDHGITKIGGDVTKPCRILGMIRRVYILGLLANNIHAWF